MSGSRKLNNKSNVISENFKKIPQRKWIFTTKSLRKIRTNGITIIQS